MERPGFLLCICPDGRLLRDHIESRLAAHPPATGTWERQVFWGDEPLPAPFWEHLTLQGLFGTPRALVVRNAQNLDAETWKRLSTAMGRPNALAWPILCLEVGFERGQPKVPAHISKLQCYSFAQRKDWLWVSQGLDERGLRSFVQARARALGLTFAPAAGGLQGGLEALCAVLPADATAATAELEKLALLLPAGGQITPEHAALVSHAPELDMFAFMRVLQSASSPMGVWRQVLRDQTSSDSMVFPFLGMLLREARQLWQLHAGEPVRLPPSVLTAKQQMASRLGNAGLARIWELALEAEMGIKTGERNPDQAMEALTAGLFALFRPTRKAPGLRH